MLQFKVCGMRDSNNINELIKVQPDFIGLIFHEKSPRNVSEKLKIDSLQNIIFTGVFVNESENFIEEKISEYGLKAIQLHGQEDPDFCEKLNKKGIIVIKAFNIHEAFNFKTTEFYEKCCDYFLFDAFGKQAGGNGTTFQWELLNNYKGSVPFFLSGGIDEKMATTIKKIGHSMFKGVDVNSKFEIEPGFKNIKKIKQFSHELRG